MEIDGTIGLIMVDGVQVAEAIAVDVVLHLEDFQEAEVAAVVFLVALARHQDTAELVEDSFIVPDDIFFLFSFGLWLSFNFLE